METKRFAIWQKAGAACAAVVMAIGMLLFQGVAFADETGRADAPQERTALSTAAVLETAADSMATAQEIPLGKATSGNLRGSDYPSLSLTDWYKVELPGAGRFDIDFDTDYGDVSAEWDVKVYDSEEEIVAHGIYNSIAPMTLLSTGLPAGTIYISVNGGRGSGAWSGATYYLTPRFTASADWELELNDSMPTATPVRLNSTIHGTLSYYKYTGNHRCDDDDWYSIALTEPGRLDILFDTEYGDTDRQWKVTMYDSEKRSFWERGYNGIAPVKLASVGLAAGTYYLQVEDGSGADTSVYSITPQFTASDDWETELNDSFASANPIDLNSAVYGNLMSEGDFDWYCFTLNRPGTFKLDFSTESDALLGEDGRGQYDACWILKLYDSEKNELWEDEAHASIAATTMCQEELAAGKYYVCISTYSSSGWNIGAYAITPRLLTSIEDATVSVPRQTYTGHALEPAPVVTLDGEVLAANTDYKVSYEDNVDAGTAKLTVKGKGIYTGKVTKKFKIAKAANKVKKVKGRTVTVKRDKWNSVKIKPSKAYSKLGKAKGKTTFKKVKKGSTKRIVVNKKTGKLSVKAGTKKGTYRVKVRIKAKGNSNYKAGKKTVTVKVRVK